MIGLNSSVKQLCNNRITEIEISKIKPNTDQPRKVFNESELLKLSESIKKDGLIQPIVVRMIKSGEYELVAGERRLRASLVAGLITIPCIVRKIDSASAAEFALIENLLRQNLNYFEEAFALEKLITKYNLSQKQICEKMFIAQSTLANKLRLLKLPDVIKNRVLNYNLTERHARALLKLSSISDMNYVIDNVINKNLNVGQTENLIERILKDGLYKKRQKYTFVFQDLRIFSNSIEKTIDILKKSGIKATSKKDDTDDFIVYTIKIPKTSS